MFRWMLAVWVHSRPLRPLSGYVILVTMIYVPTMMVIRVHVFVGARLVTCVVSTRKLACRQVGRVQTRSNRTVNTHAASRQVQVVSVSATGLWSDAGSSETKSPCKSQVLHRGIGQVGPRTRARGTHTVTLRLRVYVTTNVL